MSGFRCLSNYVWRLFIPIQLLAIPLSSTAQLKEFEVSEMERPDVAVVQANTQWPDDALLLVYSSLDGLQFRSSMGAVDKQTYNNRAGRYEILVKTVKQMMFVAKPGFMEQKIATINPNPKDVFYYKVEELQSNEEQGLQELRSLLKEGILTTEQYETFVAQINGSEEDLTQEPVENVDSAVSFRTYSEEEKFCKDAEGNVYPTTQIGNQLWMAENLKTGKYADGTPIVEVKKKKEWSGLDVGASSKAENVSELRFNPDVSLEITKTIKEKSGKIYNWAALQNKKGICPKGWKVPSISEVEKMVNYLESQGLNGEALKTSRPGVWPGMKKNASGFSAFPVRSRSEDGSFDDGKFTRWWTSSSVGNSAYYFSISSSSSSVTTATKRKEWGMPLRCIKE